MFKICTVVKPMINPIKRYEGSQKEMFSEEASPV